MYFVTLPLFSGEIFIVGCLFPLSLDLSPTSSSVWALADVEHSLKYMQDFIFKDTSLYFKASAQQCLQLDNCSWKTHILEFALEKKRKLKTEVSLLKEVVQHMTFTKSNSKFHYFCSTLLWSAFIFSKIINYYIYIQQKILPLLPSEQLSLNNKDTMKKETSE